jgi:hypothetical protein
MGHEHPKEIMASINVSFGDAREKYKKYGACKIEYAGSKWVREPMADEMPELYE